MKVIFPASPSFFTKIAYMIALWFGAGTSPFMAGTVGSFFAIPFIFFVIYFAGVYGLVGFTLLVFILGLWASKVVLKYAPHDPNFVVIDEVLGMCVTLLPFSYMLLDCGENCWFYYVAAFILFRVFDIVKPFPVSWVDKKVDNAWGVMLDDVLAGIYAAGTLFLCLWAYGILF